MTTRKRGLVFVGWLWMYTLDGCWLSQTGTSMGLVCSRHLPVVDATWCLRGPQEQVRHKDFEPENNIHLGFFATCNGEWNAVQFVWFGYHHFEFFLDAVKITLAKKLVQKRSWLLQTQYTSTWEPTSCRYWTIWKVLLALSHQLRT